MFSVAAWARRSRSAAKIAPLAGLAAFCWSAEPAAAQFGWFGAPEPSAQDVYETIQSHGFRLAGPLMQNRDVYVADVFDRRQRRERLIISRDTGRIVQRFMVDVDRGADPYASLSTPAYGAPRRRADPDFLSRVFRGFGDEDVPRPPADVGTADREDAVEPPVLPRAPQKAARSKPADVVTRREDAPIAARPLTPQPLPAPATSGAAAPATPAPMPANAPPAPEKAQAAPSSPPPTRATVINTDPLRIPGTKDATAKPGADTTAAIAPKPSVPAPAPQPAPAKPAPKPAPTDVPVAPLD